MKCKLAHSGKTQAKKAQKEDSFIKDFLIRNNVLSPPTPEEAAKNSVRHILKMTNSTLAKRRIS